MQLNFLQEDLLELMQQATPAPLAARGAKTTKPKPEPEVEQASAASEQPAETSSEHKAPSAFKTISEAATMLGVPAYVLRFWEGQFPQIKPTKSRGGRRYYRPQDMEVLAIIKHLLYNEGYTIKGARKAFAQMKNDLELAAQPVPVRVNLPKPAAKTKPVITPKQKSQLAAVRSELLSLKEQLSVYLQASV